MLLHFVVSEQPPLFAVDVKLVVAYRNHVSYSKSVTMHAAKQNRRAYSHARARAVPKKERGNGVWRTRKWGMENEEMVFLVTCVLSAIERPCDSLYSEKLP